MILYHGTNIDFDSIDLEKGNAHRDFGRGFYLTDILQQAQKMAVRRCEQTEKGMPVVQAYQFDEHLLYDGDLKVKTFSRPTEEWAMFVYNNRTKRVFKHDYDIVVGPVADDGVAYQLNLFKQKLISITQLVSELEYKRLNSQYYFGTSRAVETLIRIWD